MAMNEQNVTLADEELEQDLEAQDLEAQDQDLEAQIADSGAPPEDVEEIEEETPQDGREWFVIHTYSGYENKVKTNLEHRIASMGVQDKIFQVVIPTEEEIEIKDGQRRTVQKKV